MAYKVKIYPAFTLKDSQAIQDAALAFGFPMIMANQIKSYREYGWLFFTGDTEVPGAKFHSAVRIDFEGAYSDTCWTMVLDSEGDGNPIVDSNGVDIGIPPCYAGLQYLDATRTYFLSPVVSSVCGKIDGAYQIPFSMSTSSAKGKVFEFNGKKYVVTGQHTGSLIWFIHADPTE